MVLSVGPPRQAMSASPRNLLKMLIRISKYLFFVLICCLQGAIKLVLVLPCNILKNVSRQKLNSDLLYCVLALIVIIQLLNSLNPEIETINSFDHS